MSDWMARPLGRFFVWFVYLGAGLTAVALVIGLLQGIDWLVMRLTGSRPIALTLGTVFLLGLIAAFNAWVWTPGNRVVEAMMRVMRRMEGREP